MTPRPIACPRCGNQIDGNHDWCLKCGYAARTRLVRSRDWRVPVAALVALVAVSLAALAIAFVQITKDPAKPKVIPELQTTTATTSTTP